MRLAIAISADCCTAEIVARPSGNFSDYCAEPLVTDCTSMNVTGRR